MWRKRLAVIASVVGVLLGVAGPAAATARAATVRPTRPLLFVPSFSSNVVSVFDLRTNHLVKSIGIDARGACCAYSSPDGRTMYIVDGLSPYVTVIDTRALKVTHVIPIHGTWGDHGATMPANGRMFWLDDLPQGDIEGINTASDEVTRYFKGVGGLFANSPDGRWLFVDDKSTFEVLSATTGQVVASTTLPYSGSIAVQMSPDGQTAYVVGATTNSLPVGSVSSSYVEAVRVHDPLHPTVVKAIEIGSLPLIGSFTPDRRQLWVPNSGDGTISVIDLASNRLVRTISTGRYLTYVGFYQDRAYVMESPYPIPPDYATSLYLAIPGVIAGSATAPESGSTTNRPVIDPPEQIALYDRITYKPLAETPLAIPSEAFVTETVSVPSNP